MLALLRLPAQAALARSCFRLPSHAAHGHIQTGCYRPLLQPRISGTQFLSTASSTPRRLGGHVPRSSQYDIASSTLTGPALVALLGFAFTCFDVTSPSSLHLLRPFDEAAHAFAAAQTPYIRKVVADTLLSNTFIGLGIIGWFLTCGTILADFNWRSSAVVGLACLFFAFAAGPVPGDAWLVAFFKNIFQRIRPSDYHISYAFPSGHTCSTVFLWGTLLFVLMPLALTGKPASAAGALAVVDVLKKFQGSWLLLGGAALTTATGRVLADAHWATDTLCGAAFSTMVVATLLQGAKLILAIKM